MVFEVARSDRDKANPRARVPPFLRFSPYRITDRLAIMLGTPPTQFYFILVL